MDFISIKLASDDATGPIWAKLRTGGATSVTVHDFKQAPIATQPGTFVFFGLGGDNTNGRLPYRPGIVLFGKISAVDRGAAKGVVNSLDIEILHVLPEDHHVTKEMIKGARAFKAEFEVLPHWGLRHTASQTALPFREDATVKALLRVMNDVDPTFQPAARAKAPELAPYFDGVAVPVTRAESAAHIGVGADSFVAGLEAAGLKFGVNAEHSTFVRAFFAAVMSKRFVILSGLSGSGKTQIALRLGDWLCAEPEDRQDQVCAVPVRPDWTGAEAIFGYADVLQPTRDGHPAWHVPSVLRFLLAAAADPQRPYLLILDEMNLAHVERYFADFLSGLESDEPVLPDIQPDEDDGTPRLVSTDRRPLPKNLFVVGTVNVDETTYMFSPKVLDRAHTFEFRVATETLGAAGRWTGICPAGASTAVRAYLDLSKDTEFQDAAPHPDAVMLGKALRLVHRRLSAFGLEFGHRTFSDALRFASLYATVSPTAGPLGALDRILMQKVLPRLHGSRRRLEPVLCSLAAFCAVGPGGVEPDGNFDPERFTGTPVLPVSFSKLRRMTSLVRQNQYVSFAE